MSYVVQCASAAIFSEPAFKTSLLYWRRYGKLLGPPRQVAKNGPFSYNPYEGFISANDQTHGARWSFGPKHKRSSIIARAPANVLAPSTNDLRSSQSFRKAHFGEAQNWKLHFRAGSSKIELLKKSMF